MRLRSGSSPLIRSHFGVALNQLHAIEWDRKLFRHELSLRGVEPVPQLALAGKSGNAAIGIDGKPAIHLIAACSVEALGKDGFGRQAESDYQSTTGFQESASIDTIHAFTP